MQIPKYLFIKRSKWTVKISSKKLDTELYRGMTRFDTHEILLDPSIPRNELEETFIHEMFHSVFPAKIVSDKTEEKIVEKMSKTFYKTLIDSGLTIAKSRKKKPRTDKINKKK